MYMYVLSSIASMLVMSERHVMCVCVMMSTRKANVFVVMVFDFTCCFFPELSLKSMHC